MPLLTIITINRNNANGLKRTLASIFNQSATDFEYIVVDGVSNDESCKLLQTFKLPNSQTFKYISESDSGIYNAMNKGTTMATGEYLLFINSGDELASSEVVKSFQSKVKPNMEICSGDLMLIHNSKQKIQQAPTEISLSYCINAGLTHPNTFIRKSLFEKYGLYNEANKIISDWEFFLIVAGLNNCRYQKLDFEIARFYEDGISSQNKELVNQEMQQAIIRLVPEPILKDINQLQLIESQFSHPAHELVQQSAFIRKLLLVYYKVWRKLRIGRR